MSVYAALHPVACRPALPRAALPHAALLSIAALLHPCSPHAAEGLVEVSLAAGRKALLPLLTVALICHFSEDPQGTMTSYLKYDRFRLSRRMSGPAGESHCDRRGPVYR